MGQEKWLAYYSAPRKRHMPLKRYRIKATLQNSDIVYLVIRARSKKTAKQLAMKSYNLAKAEVIAVLGKSKEEDFYL